MAVIGGDQLGRTAAAAARAGARLGRVLPASVAPRIVEAALVIVLAILLAQTVLKLAAPLPVPAKPAVPPARSAQAPATVKNPFTLSDTAPGDVSGSVVPDAAETTLALVLHGTWVDPERGAAIIQTPDGKQGTFAVGEDICCGAKLEGVYPDQVIITRAGARESLRLANKKPPLAEAVPPAQPQTDEEPMRGYMPGNIKSLSQLVRIRPAQAGEGGPGGVRFALYPAGDRRAFESLGLREGDVLVSVNGVPAPTGLDGVSQLLSALAGQDQVMLTVDRDGSSETVEISLASAS